MEGKLNAARYVLVLSTLLMTLAYSWVACWDGGQNVGGAAVANPANS